MADLLNTNPNDSYGDDAIVTLSPREHIRLRPGMYIGKLGDGTQADDGIYVLIKEVVDNSVDEFIMGAGRQIDISIEDKVVSVRDYGRGIPLKSLAAAVSEMNTGGKYGGSAFKKTVGLNGVGVKAVNMLSGEFTARSVRDGEARTVTFAKGLEVSDKWESGVREKNGTFISFRVDEEVFGEYAYNLEYVEQMVRNYTYLNLGLTFNFNGNSYVSKNGLLDLLNENMTEEPLYAPIHLSGDDIEVAIAHGTGYGESYFSFVNGQYTSQGRYASGGFPRGHRQDRQGVLPQGLRPVGHPHVDHRRHFGQGHRPGLRIADQDQARIEGDRARRVDAQFRHRFPGQAPRRLPAQAFRDGAGAPAEDRRERKGAQSHFGHPEEGARDGQEGFAQQQEIARLQDTPHRQARAGRTVDDLHHRGQLGLGFDHQEPRCAHAGRLFAARQAAQLLRADQKVVYENEEFNLLQAALNIEEDMDNLRYNKVIIATDADVDGMHIRLLMMTFFLQFFPDVIRQGHLFVLQTPCSACVTRRRRFTATPREERQKAVGRCGANAEITRFKGLGEISPDEFREFIGENIRLDKVRITKDDPIHDLLEFYMGKNTYERQGFIIDNLRIEEDIVEQDLAIN